MKICILHEFDSQTKVARKIQSELGNHDVETFSITGLSDVAIFINHHMHQYDIVFLTIGGTKPNYFMLQLDQSISSSNSKARPLIVSMTVGLTLDRVYYSTFTNRALSDIVLVNKKSDVIYIMNLFKSYDKNIAPYKVFPVRNPIFDKKYISRSQL